MRKLGIFFVVLLAGGVCFSQEEAEETAAVSKTVQKSSLTATRADSKLNETLLHKSVLDYSLPQEIEEVAQKCVAEEIEACFFSF